MSDETPTTEVESEQPAPKETDWQAEAKKWEARSKTNFERAKANEAAAQRLAEIEESSKTELQKWQERAEKAEAAAARFESERQITAWKSSVSAETGVPADVLSGSTLEELQAHAEKLKPLLQASQRGPYVPGPGNTPSSPANGETGAFLGALFGNH